MGTHLYAPYAFLLSAAFLCGCAWIGHGILAFVFRPSGAAPAGWNGYVGLFFSLACGLAACLGALFALALVGRFDAAGFACGGALLLGLATLGAPRRRGAARWLDLPHPGRLSRMQVLAVLADVLLVGCLLAAVASLALRPPGFWDDTSYHLPYARTYLEQHRLAVNEFLRFPLFPNHMELLFGFGLQLGGVLMAQEMATLPLFIVAIGLIGAARQLLQSTWAGVLAGVLLFATGPVAGVVGYAYDDNGLALFCWAALFALMQVPRAAPAIAWRWIAVAAVLAGTAADVKLFGLAWAGLLGLYVLGLTRQPRAAAVFGIGVALAGSWWYLRSYLVSGDPIHPLGAQVFGYYLWNEQDLRAQMAEQSNIGVARHAWEMLPALWQVGAGWIAPALLVPLFWKRTDRAILGAYFVLVAYLAFWFYRAQVDRYLAPMLALGCLLVAWVLVQSGLGRLGKWAAQRWSLGQQRALAVLFVLALGLPVVADQLAAARARLDAWDAYLHGRPGYDLFQAANALSPSFGPRLVQVRFSNARYFFVDEAIGDWFGPARFSLFISCGQEQQDCVMRAPAEVARNLALLHARMLILNSRKISIDIEALRAYFDVRYQSDDGFLLTLK